MEKSNSFSKGVIYTLSIIFLFILIAAIVGVVAYNGYKDAALEASYTKDGVETKIKIEKKNKEKSNELYSLENPAGKYEGEEKDGMPHGQGRMYWANGDYYEGNWENGKPKGKGIKLFTLGNGEKYEGETIDGLPGGSGKYLYANGDVFEGEYENGTQKQNGYGLYTWKNGETLEGYWISKNGKLHPEGKGKYNFLNGDVFIGEYKNGKAYHGRYEITDLGDWYFGYFKDDKFHGQGVYNSKNGREYEGNWENNLMSGYGKIKYEDGRVYDGYFLKGLRHGQGTLIFPDGKKLEGIFQNDEFTGSEKLLTKKTTDKSDKDKSKEILINKIITDEKYFALVIGNNNYQYLEKLDAAENDAKVIADILENKYGFEVELLLNADYKTTVDSVFNITNKLKKNDNLLVYYAGHGEFDKAENRGYWLPVNASKNSRAEWITNQTIVDRVKATKAKHVLLMVDSCFSGSLMRGGELSEKNETIDKKYIERLKKKKTRLVITSGGNEPVVDSDGGNHSLFALKLIDTLKNNDNVINSQILFENIRRYVVANADQTPERAMVHKTGHDGGDFLFFPK